MVKSQTKDPIVKTLLATSLIVLAAASAAMAEPITVHEHKDWSVDYVPRTVDGRGALCVAGTTSFDLKDFNVVMHEDGAIEAGFMVVDWGLNPGEVYNARIDVDYAVWHVSMTARSDSILVLDLLAMEDGGRFVRQVRDGNGIALYRRDGTLLFTKTLNGSAAALTALDACAVTYLDEPASTPSPARKPTHEPPPARISWDTYPDNPGRVWIEISGMLTPETADEFAATVAVLKAKFEYADVWLSSDGGSLVAGIEIGETIRQAGLWTVVPAGSTCASSCALAWLGGVGLAFESDLTTYVGFHQPSNRTTGEVSPTVVARVGAYVARLGYGDGVVVLATEAPPADMLWLDRDMAEAAGLNVVILKPAN